MICWTHSYMKLIIIFFRIMLSLLHYLPLGHGLMLKKFIIVINRLTGLFLRVLYVSLSVSSGLGTGVRYLDGMWLLEL